MNEFELTTKLLNHDPLAEMENLLGGKHCSEFNDSENLLCLLSTFSSGEIKQRHLKSIGDTYWGMSWFEFKALLSRNGFEIAYEYTIERHGGTDDAALFFNTEKGFVIFADSFRDSINSGKLYCEIKCDPGYEVYTMQNLKTGGCINSKDNIYESAHDVREGLFHSLAVLEMHGEFLPIWTSKDRFLWFVDSVETDQKGYDYVALSQEKIDKCPQRFRNIINR